MARTRLRRSHRHQCRESLDALPKVLQSDVFILRVLVVVIVCDRHRDGNGVQILSDDRQRQTATRRGKPNDRLRGSRLHRLDDRLRDRQIHRRASSAR